VGNLYLRLQDHSIRESLYLGILFLVVAALTFFVGIFLVKRTINLEGMVKEKALEMNRHMSYIVHELKNPLTAINNMAYILQKHSKSEKCSEMGKQISEVALNLEEKINYLLNFSKVDFSLLKEDTSKINLRNFIQSYLTKLAYLVRNKEVEMENQVSPSIEMEVSVELMEILLSNLISNAIKYTPDGKVVIKSLEKEDEIRILIEDTGIGISLEDKDRIFEVFYRSTQARETEKGSGIGLYLTKRVIDALNWDIRVESPISHGKGSRVSIIIPRSSVSVEKTNKD
jgi:signal transduction histidine kinase